MQEEKEIKIVNMMIKMYCHGKHKSKKGELCSDCNELFLFVKTKRGKCPYGDNKNYCSQCKIHCYRSDPVMREKIRSVMKYAAPRMCFTHPVLTFSHLHATIKGKREAKNALKKNKGELKI